MKTPIDLQVILWICVIGPLVFLGILVRNFTLDLHAAGFKETTGVISHSEISRWVVADEVINYRYTVAGREYENNLYSFVKRGWFKGDLEKFPLGREVVVYYDPTDPTVSVLSRGNEDPAYYVMLFLIAPGLLLWVVALSVGIFQDRRLAAASKVAFMLLEDNEVSKTLKTPTHNPMMLGALTWCGACYGSCMIAMPCEIPHLTIMLSAASFLVGVVVCFLYARFAATRPAWTVDPFQKTLTFFDPQSPTLQTSVSFHALKAFFLRPRKESWLNRRIRKTYIKNLPETKNELCMRYIDDSGNSNIVRLAFCNDVWLNQLREWLVRECSFGKDAERD